jgi:hypothetical protein
MKRIFTIKNILITLILILFDLAVYIILGLLLMTYDDFYDESKGEYWSLESMTFWQKVNYIGLNVWNVINLIVIGVVFYRIIKRVRKKALNH